MTAALFDERPYLPELWTKASLLGRLSTPDEFRGMWPRRQCIVQSTRTSQNCRLTHVFA